MNECWRRENEPSGFAESEPRRLSKGIESDLSFKVVRHWVKGCLARQTMSINRFLLNIYFVLNIGDTMKS